MKRTCIGSILHLALGCAALLCSSTRAEEANALYARGVEALKQSQSNPRAIVDAARLFAKASAQYQNDGETERAVEMNSFLYWCKKKMSLQDIEAFIKGGETAVAEKLNAVEGKKVEAGEAQVWLNRAENFAQRNPSAHLLIAVRFFEVADRFKTTEIGVAAMDRSLKAMQQVQSAPGERPAASIPAPPPMNAAAHVPAPDAAKQKEALKTIKELLKDDYARRGVADKRDLGQKLLKQGIETNGDVASKFVLLNEARSAAGQGGDAETAVKAVDSLAKTFDVNAGDLKMESLAACAQLVATVEEARTLARFYLRTVDESIAMDNFESGLKLSAAGEAVARKGGDTALASHFSERGKTLRALRAEFPKIKGFQQSLKDKPDDADASLAVGKFNAFLKGDWTAGLPYLARGSDGALKDLAAKELTGGLDAAALADGWMALAEKQPAHRKRIQEHASLLYFRALPGLQGLDNSKVERKLAQGVTRADAAWLSKDATYTVSSVYEAVVPSPRLLNGQGGGHDQNSAPMAFHTGQDEAPSIVVDLGAVYDVLRLEIVNRHSDSNNNERARTLTVWASQAGSEGPWVELWRAEKAQPDWKVELPGYFPGRYVKIGLREKRYLHLFSVKVFGRAQ